MDKPILITVGGGGLYDPAPGTTVYSNPNLVGKDFYIEKIGYGTYDSTLYTVNASGGFTNSQPFVANEKYYIHSTGLTYQPTSNSYTNGYNLPAVLEKLFSRLGWVQPTIAGATTLQTPNNISTSGRYFNDGSFHALVSPVNVKAVQEDPNISDNDFNLLLQRLQKSAILRALNGVFNVREYFEQGLVYERLTRSISNHINNIGLFLGYDIKVSEKFDVAVQIDSAQFQFDQDVTFPLYLFKDGKKSPIWSQTVTAVANEETVVDFSDLILNYISGTTKGDTFYLGFFQSDLGTARAIQEQTVEMNPSYMYYARPVQCDVLGVQQINPVNRRWTVLPNGFNLEISSFRDHTQQIRKKSSLFDELIGLCMAVMVAEMVLNAVRSNGTERLLKEQTEKWALQLELDGAVAMSESPQIIGLKQRVLREMERVREEFYACPKSLVVNMADCDENYLPAYYKY